LVGWKGGAGEVFRVRGKMEEGGDFYRDMYVGVGGRKKGGFI
jgi:hypothetical protein